MIPQTSVSNGSRAFAPAKANYDLLGSLRTPQHPPQAKSNVQPPSDPFAALSTPASRTGSPFHFQQSLHPPTSSSATLLDIGVVAPQSRPPTTAPQTNVVKPAIFNDDEWTFTSSLPDHAHEVNVVNTSIHVNFLISRPPQLKNAILINSNISNNTTQPITDLTFQLAVTKVITCSFDMSEY